MGTSPNNSNTINVVSPPPSTMLDLLVEAQVMQGQVRCLLKLGQQADALHVLDRLNDEPRFAEAVDNHGRQIVPNAQLLAVQLLDDARADRRRDVA